MGRILIVDDEPEISALVASVVVMCGHTPKVVADAPGARQKLAEPGEPWVLMFVDQELPGDSGIDLLLEFREQSSYSEVPRVLLTAHPDGGMRMAAAGLDDVMVMSKPFRLSQLRSVIGRLTDC